MENTILCNIELLHTQESIFNYQIILETKGEYNAIDSNSEVNSDNWMNLEEFSSLSQLYPILGFKNTWGKLDTKLQVEANIKNYNFDKDSTDFSFQELYTQFELEGKHFFIFGKKRLDWGTGMIWNPTNFFIQKDPIRTQSRLEGLFMLNYSYLFGRNTLSFYLFPEKEGKNFKAALRYEYSKERVDASLSFVEYGKYQQFGYDISYGGNLFTAYCEGVLRNYTKSFALSDIGTLITPQNRSKRFRSEFVLGTSIIFNSNLSFSGEYHFREDYLSKSDVKLYKKHLPSNIELFDPLSVGKHTLFGNVEYKETYSRWSINLRSFYDITSNQLAISPVGILSLNNFQFELTSMFYNNSLSIHNIQTSLLVSCFF
ncbi:hypothetical protein M2451_002696 [Dysgonomonas sp. PFB1-18]|uniref:hypothetical protein n=1 Tax=unclassified Dysgonomonas TaxID=2630389 RepID=UPI002476E128|nr:MULTISPECIES: hypothetical protein [unclassified Dysgonomonas]MDH6309418.1 hypothetical protein [Dysgonomonas sp. PF1-14]MDH6339717.1 hypothetical protein [Dysgonomonas sp. PF1-16]MDH6381365.1 hypothetical protein [Dysgonomonas sp. PFB1-18]MDH6398580.1 hypothetical protein [Dysgonomonas sp. PF1-23]